MFVSSYNDILKEMFEDGIDRWGKYFASTHIYWLTKDPISFEIDVERNISRDWEGEKIRNMKKTIEVKIFL